MNLILGALLATLGSDPALKCTFPSSDLVVKRSESNQVGILEYYNKGFLVRENINEGWVTVNKYNKTMTLEMNCRK